MSETKIKQSSYITADEAFRIGEENSEHRDYLQAVEFYQIAAEKGHLLAQCRLGECYLYGRGIKADKDKAIALIEPVAEQGIADAQHALGVFYHITSGKIDEIKAREWNERAAKQGHREAQFSLGNSLEQGYYDAPINYEEAVKWYTLSANQGKVSAQYSLGYCYEIGRGVEQSDEMAIKWYQKAAKQGYSPAKDKIKDLKRRMMEKRVFISHSSQDKEIANIICSSLENSGIGCWIAPRDIQYGSEWAGEIADAIKMSRLFVFILTKNSNESRQCPKEIAIADRVNIPMICIVVDDVPLNSTLEYYFSSKQQAVMVDTSQIKTQAVQIVSSVKKLLNSMYK